MNGTDEGPIRVGMRVHVETAAPWETESHVLCGRAAAISVQDDGRLAVWVADNTGETRGFPMEECAPCPENGCPGGLLGRDGC